MCLETCLGLCIQKKKDIKRPKKRSKEFYFFRSGHLIVKYAALKSFVFSFKQMEQAHIIIHLECGFFGIHLNAAPTAACARHFELPWQHYSPAKTEKSHRNDLSVPIILPIGKFYAHFSAMLQIHTEHTEPHKRSKVSAPPSQRLSCCPMANIQHYCHKWSKVLAPSGWNPSGTCTFAQTPPAHYPVSELMQFWNWISVGKK